MHQIDTINLKSYYLVLFLSILVGISVSLILVLLFSLPFYFYIVFALIVSFIFIKLNEKRFINNVEIYFSNKNLINVFFLEENKTKTFEVRQIKGYKFKFFLKNYPVFEILLDNNDIIKFNCLEKVNPNLDDFIVKLDRIRDKDTPAAASKK